jgi:hypothetical protein
VKLPKVIFPKPEKPSDHVGCECPSLGIQKASRMHVAWTEANAESSVGLPTASQAETGRRAISRRSEALREMGRLACHYRSMSLTTMRPNVLSFGVLAERPFARSDAVTSATPVA